MDIQSLLNLRNSPIYALSVTEMPVYFFVVDFSCMHYTVRLNAENDS